MGLVVVTLKKHQNGLFQEERARVNKFNEADLSDLAAVSGVGGESTNFCSEDEKTGQ